MNDQKILIVDDAGFMRNLLGNTIKEIGYLNLYFADDGTTAIEKAAEIKPDIITLDISMPIMDGLEAVSKILEVSPKSKIIMVTAVTGQTTIKQAIKNGAIDYLKKPFDKSEVEDILRRHLT